MSNRFKYSGFKLEIQLGNDAMRTPANVSAALKEVCHRMPKGAEAGIIRDVNGNTVGSWEFVKA